MMSPTADSCLIRVRWGVTLKAENGVAVHNMQWQHADVNTTIMSVRRLCKKSSRVEVDKRSGTITLDDGNTKPFCMVNGVYVVKCVIPKRIAGDYVLGAPEKDTHKRVQVIQYMTL